VQIIINGSFGITDFNPKSRLNRLRTGLDERTRISKLGVQPSNYLRHHIQYEGFEHELAVISVALGEIIIQDPQVLDSLEDLFVFVNPVNGSVLLHEYDKVTRIAIEINGVTYAIKFNIAELSNLLLKVSNTLNDKCQSDVQLAMDTLIPDLVTNGTKELKESMFVYALASTFDSLPNSACEFSMGLLTDILRYKLTNEAGTNYVLHAEHEKLDEVFWFSGDGLRTTEQTIIDK